MSAPPWSIHYSDGAANAYQFEATEGGAARFDYDPVTPERSSTGLYSGGPPREGPLDDAQVAALWRAVRALEAEPRLHVTVRGKGTGAFAITEGATTRSFIIARGPELAAFDALVGSL